MIKTNSPFTTHHSPLSNLGKQERETQNRVILLLNEELGYNYLGNWKERDENSNIEEDILREYLNRKYYSENLIGKALHELRNVANDQSRSLLMLTKTFIPCSAMAWMSCLISGRIKNCVAH
jgi:hypothetical protein